MWNFSWKNIGFMLLSSSAWRAWVLRNSENFGVNISLWSCLQCPALVTNQAFWSLDAGKWLMFSTRELSSFVLWRPIFFSVQDSTGVLRAGGEKRIVVIMKNRSTFCQLYYCFKIIYSLHTFFFSPHPFLPVLGTKHAPCPLVLHRDSMMEMWRTPQRSGPTSSLDPPSYIQYSLHFSWICLYFISHHWPHILTGRTT